MITLTNVTKRLGGRTIVDRVNMTIERGEFVAIVGKSGSGKTTLLNIMGLITQPDEGVVTIADVSTPNRHETMKLRRHTFGYITQNFLLLDNETVRTNLVVAKPYYKALTKEAIREALEVVGLDETYLTKKVYELSGGEQQRISIARVLLKESDIIFADEPTGNLDDENTALIIELLHKLQQRGKTIVCVTHSQAVAKAANRIMTL